MKFLPYLLKHLRRNWLRTLSTVLAMALCIFLFCVLETVIKAVNFGLQSASASRLVTRHAVSLVFNVPLSYKERIAGVEGVKRVSTVSWFGGSLAAKKEEQPRGSDSASSSGPDFSKFFANLAVDPETYLDMYPEYILKADERQAWFQDLRGCIIGRELANRFGWKVGDSFFLESFIPPYRRRSGPFEFVVKGIYDVDLARYPGTDARNMFFHYKYLYEGLGQRVAAGSYAIEIADPEKAGVTGRAIDALFENSDAQTKTETEAAFRAGFVALAGNLTLLLRFIGLTVTFTILLVTANTMSLAVRERRTEIAVLKTLGFKAHQVMTLVLGEALIIGALGGAVGLFLARGMIHALPSLPFIGDAVRAFPNLGLSLGVGGIGFGMALALGGLAGLLPAAGAYRARITDMLRQV
jgi:putative ABC transport system permease protein